MRYFTLLFFLLSSLPFARAAPPVATFSIVAYDPKTKELGIAVASKFPAVGSVVPWAKAGVGAIATQSFANTRYGPKGLELLEAGMAPGVVLADLTVRDPAAAHRQVGMIDAEGRAVTFTGGKCNPWAGGKTGKHYAIQGNLLAGPRVVEAMAKAFEEKEGKLSYRLLTALEAGEAAGGDKRGKQSAALLIVREGWGYAMLNDRFRDLRVDHHDDPIPQLWRVLVEHASIFPHPTRD